MPVEKKHSPGPFSRLLVMGDIHGRYDKLRKVLSLSGYDPQSDRLIFLGDYVDRGPDSCLVVQEVKQLVAAGAVALYGNHEDMMLRALKDRHSGQLVKDEVEQWYANGGEITLASYRSQAKLLDEHLELFAELPLWHEEQGFLFVHAGIRPGKSINGQRMQDLIWIREEYILGYNGPQDIVAGHTPTQYLKRYGLFGDIDDASMPVIREHKFFLDTGVAWGGPLTLMELHSREIWQG